MTPMPCPNMGRTTGPPQVGDFSAETLATRQCSFVGDFFKPRHLSHPYGVKFRHQRDIFFTPPPSPRFKAGNEIISGQQVGRLASSTLAFGMPDTSERGQTKQWPTSGQIGCIIATT